MTFLDYMKKHKNDSFRDLKFNELDGLVLVALSYIRFEEVFNRNYIPFKDIVTRFLSFSKEKQEKYYMFEHDHKFMNRLNDCPRYKNLIVIDKLTYFNKRAKTQFFAFATRIGENEIAVTFRGTDQTLLGWYESLSLGYDEYIGGQKRSKEFLSYLMKKFPDDRFYILGHSKGGNYALYAAATQKIIHQLRILKVYNYDGPMLLDKTKKKTNFATIRKKVVTYLPNESIVGTCLGNVENSYIVDSEFMGLIQHVYYFWKVEGEHFKKGKLTFLSKAFAKEFPNWVSSMTESEKRSYVNIVYSWIEKANIKRTKDFLDIFKINKLIALMLNEKSKKKRELGQKILVLLKSLLSFK